MSQQFHLVNESVKQNAINYIRQLPVDSKRPLILDVKESTRTAIQNRKMWPLLKDLITALVAKTKKQEQRMAPGLDGGVVMFGQRTSKMTIPQMVEVIETIYWFGTQQGVIFG
ncbi:recombination protein NinB [Enterobacter hormaechei]